MHSDHYDKLGSDSFKYKTSSWRKHNVPSIVLILIKEKKIARGFYYYGAIKYEKGNNLYLKKVI